MARLSSSCVLALELMAAKIRRNALDICMQRCGYAGQGVALADIAACLYFGEMRADSKGWFHDRFVLSNGHDAIMTYGVVAEHGSYTTPSKSCAATTRTAPGSTRAQSRGGWALRSPRARWGRDCPRRLASPGASA